MQRSPFWAIAGFVLAVALACGAWRWLWATWMLLDLYFRTMLRGGA